MAASRIIKLVNTIGPYRAPGSYDISLSNWHK